MPRKQSNSLSISYADGIGKLADRLMNPDGVSQQDHDLYLDSFYDFIVNVWSIGYSKPEHFNLWHVKTLCDDVERSIGENKHYVAVVPRGHYKSTILGHAFAIWRLLKLAKTTRRDSSIFYLSYSYDMAVYHIKEIKSAIRSNPVLCDVMRDRMPHSDSSFRFFVDAQKIEILPAGVFSFSRGTHVDGGLIADDLLRDPENPLVHTQLEKVYEIFSREAMFIPNPGAPIVVMGTPMAPEDLLAKLQDDERFNSRVLPVFNPIPNVEILAPEIRDKENLLRLEKENPAAFATEMMLSPYFNAISYFSIKDIETVENDELESWHTGHSHREDLMDEDYVVGGLDIGKKRNPSHLVIFRCNYEQMKMVQINSTFLDRWDYTSQVDFVNDVTENFGLDRAYFDNTRAELEDRFLDWRWTPIRLNTRIRKQYAQVMEWFIKTGRLELIEDKRQRSLITSVDNNLNAPETPLGHGDSFWSIALAVMAFFESTKYGIQDLGNLTEFIQATGENKLNKNALIRLNPYVRGFKESCPNCEQSIGWESDNEFCIICNSNQEYEAWDNITLGQTRIHLEERDYIF